MKMKEVSEEDFKKFMNNSFVRKNDVRPHPLEDNPTQTSRVIWVTASGRTVGHTATRWTDPLVDKESQYFLVDI